MVVHGEYLTVNEFSRPQKKIARVRAVVMHWTANPKANAKQNRDYFEMRKSGGLGYGSAHYIIGQDGYILQCIPENEIAYHCGSSAVDPASGKIYTDYARAKFGSYASPNSSPNNCTIGIELCPTDASGSFSYETVNAAIDLCADICRRYQLTSEDITTHHAIVGWKDCPRLWVNKPALFEAFKLSVEHKLIKGC